MGTCRLLPHGGYTLLIATMSTIAWWSSLFQDGCDYAKVTGDAVIELASTIDVPYLELGFGAYREPNYVQNGLEANDGEGYWQVNYNGQCIEYPFIELDTSWKIAKAFTFLALVIGGGGTLFVWCSTCFVFSKGTWRYTGYELLLASICQCIGFLWFINTTICNNNDRPNTKCTLFWGSRSDIIACTFWFSSAIMILCKYPIPEEQKEEDNETDEEFANATADDVHRTMMAGHTNPSPPVTNSSKNNNNNDSDIPDEPTQVQHPNAQVI